MNPQELKMFEETIQYNGDYIFIKPFCDFFGIDYLNQKKIVHTNPLLKTSMSKKTSKLLFGDERERISLTKQGFITWILQLRCQIVHPNLQEKLQLYQIKIFDFMFGSIEREKNAQYNYARLNKLKALKVKINAAITKCDNNINSYLKGKLEMTRIDFTQKVNRL